MALPLGVRLALSYLAAILVGMGIVVPLAWLTVERLYLNAQRENLLAQAKLAAVALGSFVLTDDVSLAGDNAPSGTPVLADAPTPQGNDPLAYSQMSNVLPGIHTRVIDSLGAVVIDLAAPGSALETAALDLPRLAQSASGLVTAQELVSRPEIARALSGQPATAIRRVEVAGGRRVLYAAAPVLSSDGTVRQVVYLATPLPDTQWRAFPPAVRWQFGAVILAAILLAGGVGILLARRIARPLEELAGAAHAVAAGDLGQTVPEDPGIHELATLGQAFNSMTSSLQQADQAKTAFISDVSHELRTPLTVIKGTIETLQDGALDDRAGRGPLLASMSQETDRLIKLVNDLLVLTRADAGALNLQPVRLDLAELARARCDHFARAASQRQVSLRTVTDPLPSGQGDYLVLADPDRLAQVLDNLLDNAIRYSPAGSQVTVTLAREADQVACRVTDAGPGIPARHLPYIFERFYRADPARQRAEGGSGLGLAIVRGLVTAHGGRTEASSPEGQGATLTFWLPGVI
jgi:signal transduction histidine kinase